MTSNHNLQRFWAKNEQVEGKKQGKLKKEVVNKMVSMIVINNTRPMGRKDLQISLIWSVIDVRDMVITILNVVQI